MSTGTIEVTGVIRCNVKYVKAVADKIAAFFDDLENHIPTVEGSIKVKNAKPRLQPAGGKSPARKGKGAASDRG